MTDESRPTLPAPPHAPRQIGRYELLRPLDEQGRAAYVARRAGDPRDERVVVVVLDVPERELPLLHAELERCQGLRSPAIARPLEWFAHEGGCAVVFGCVAGTVLRHHLFHLWREQEPPPMKAVFHVGASLFAALAEAHGARDAAGQPGEMVHGQLAPHQVILGWRGEVELLGLGIPASVRAHAGLAAIPSDMQDFLAPEVLAGSRATPQADVYAAAAMLWSLLTLRRPPAGGARFEPLGALCPTVPAAVAVALDAALEPLVEHRSIRGGELAAVLANAAHPDGARELRWSMEIYRALATMDDTLRPLESIAPGPGGARLQLPEPLPGLPVLLAKRADTPCPVAQRPEELLAVGMEPSGEASPLPAARSVEPEAHPSMPGSEPHALLDGTHFGLGRDRARGPGALHAPGAAGGSLRGDERSRTPTPPRTAPGRRARHRHRGRVRGRPRRARFVAGVERGHADDTNGASDANDASDTSDASDVSDASDAAGG